MKNFNNIQELCDFINNMEDQDKKNADFSSLQTWGDNPPANTCEIFSWDNQNYLMQDCNGDWELVSRSEN